MHDFSNKTADVTAEPNTADVTAELTQLRADFGRLADSVSELVKSQTQTVTATMREQAGKAGDAVAANFADLSASAAKMTNSAQASMQSAGNDIEASIERNPMAAVMIAAGIGLVLGLVTARP